MRKTSIARRRVPVALVSCAMAVLAGCVDLAPPYRRPASPTAASWVDRGAGLPRAKATAATSANTLAWDRFIADAQLRSLVALALAGNRDLRVAVLNVERARALYRVQDSARQPQLLGAVTATRTRSAGVTASSDAASIQAGYEADLFGRLRNLDAAALASYFATDEARRGAQVLLVAEVATAWLNLAADRERLVLSQRTLDSQQRSLDLAVRMRALGASTGLAVAQARSTVEAVRILVAATRTQIDLDRNALELLVGAPLEATLATDVPAAAITLFDVPGDLPSAILAERPDVRAAERGLEAATANIGAARAAYFPRITLTASGGVASTDIAGLFRGGAGAFGFAPSITVPIFDGGRNDANLAVARTDREIAVATYEKSLQTAFREVADVLALRDTLVERTAGQEAFVEALQTSFRLSDAVFRQGGSSYLQVLDAQRSLYGAQQGLISLRLEEQTTRVALYKAFGGGWNDGDAAR